MHLEILDKKRQIVLEKLGFLSNYNFYLAGGTALTLSFGHRDSIDFDFFCENDIDTAKIFELLIQNLPEYKILKTYEEKNTLYVILDDSIKLSFITYRYKILKPYILYKGTNIADPIDIACMKLNAITSRQLEKDYVDLYFIFQKYKLGYILESFDEKFNNTIDRILILKSLVYFEDITEEKIKYKNGNETTFSNVKKSLIKIVKEFANNK